MKSLVPPLHPNVIRFPALRPSAPPIERFPLPKEQRPDRGWERIGDVARRVVDGLAAIAGERL